MRFVSIAALLVLAGCKHPTPDAGKTPTAQPPAERREMRRMPASNAQASKLVPVAATVGKIESVNLLGRFVVVEFSLGPMPELNQRLSVYRNKQKIGEIKITGPGWNQTIAADMVAGEAAVGDEVRE